MTNERIDLPGYRPLPLDDPTGVWVIEEGEVLVFAEPTDGAAAGRRQYLVTRKASDVLFGGAGRDDVPSTLVAVALQPARLRRIDHSGFSRLVASDGKRWNAQLDSWVAGLGRALDAVPPAAGGEPPGGGEGTFELAPGQTFRSPGTRVVWVEVQDGAAGWMGLPDERIDSTTPPVPLADGLWLQALEPLRLGLRTVDEVGLGAVFAGISRFHGRLLTALEVRERERADDLAARAREREVRSQRRMGHALQGLADLVRQRVRPDLHDGSDLFRACAEAGRVAGFRIVPPRTADDPSRHRNPVQAIARSSNIHCRQILLRDRWFAEDAGPVVAFFEEEAAGEGSPEATSPFKGRPVALVPTGPRGYELYDPADESRTLLTPALESKLRRQAFVLYSPFPADFVAAPGPLFRFGLRGYGREIAILLLTGIAATLLGMLVPHANGILIDDAIPSADEGLVVQLGLALGMTALGRALFEVSRSVAMMRASVGANHRVQASLMDRLLKLKVSFFRRYAVGDLMDRVMAVQGIFQRLSMASLGTIFGGFLAIINLCLLVYYSWWLALYAVGVGLVNLLLTWITARVLVREDKIVFEKTSANFGHVVQLVQGVSKLRAAAAEDRAFASWAQRYNDKERHSLRRQVIDDRLTVLNAMLTIVGQLVLFWIALEDLRPDEGLPELSIGEFLAFNAAFGLFLGGITSLSNTITDVLGIVKLWERAKPILDAEPEVGGRRTQPGTLRGGVGLQRLTFRYRPDCAPVLEDVSVEANPGEFVALVGPSGCGKSTIVRLILGFETPERGKVLYDGQDLADLDVDAVRRQLGVVLQSSRVRSNSIFDNIAAGAFITMEDAWDSARKAGFDEDIRQMPMGMHTIVSEGGTNLSGGQRQRLLIARALVKRPGILVLDEATSALDNYSQAVVSRSLAEMKATRIVVAHRLSTIRGADRIYVLDKGRVIQVGRFEELVEQDGVFRNLMARQRT